MKIRQTFTFEVPLSAVETAVATGEVIDQPGEMVQVSLDREEAAQLAQVLNDALGLNAPPAYQAELQRYLNMPPGTTFHVPPGVPVDIPPAPPGFDPRLSDWAGAQIQEAAPELPAGTSVRSDGVGVRPI